jgi:hypothetical protein
MRRLRRALTPGRWSLLTSVLAGGYLVIGLASPLASIRWPALAGALLMLGSLWLAGRSRPAALSALVAGAVAPSITGWWSLVIPVTGVLALLCGSLAIRATARVHRP